MSRPLVELDGVSKRFDDFVAVQSMDLNIMEGEFLAIMGSSGCGKTTTLRMLAGLDQPTGGEIRLNGEPINALRTWERDTPLVWQNLALFPFLNVVENVEFGLRMRGVGKAERRRRALNWLGKLELGEFAHRNIAQLSGGQRQRVALARSLVTEPPILLLDEPLSALDANLKVHMQSVLTALQKEIGITFVYVTHSHSEAFAMADRVVIMSKGKVEQVGSPQEIYTTPCNRFVAEFIGGKNIIEGHVAEISGTQVRVDSPHGRFTAQAAPGRTLSGNEAVAVCVGAEHLRFARAGDAHPGDNQLRCRVVGEEFVGAFITLYLRTETGLDVQAQIPHSERAGLPLEDGVWLHVGWPAEASRILRQT
ncbi:ABC transporter ATP-binding protein [Castellaniella hirudinis]|uniref:ABC transporter ATP-binding protein n=1 Tax=Castellaniella hirudinis TaxID=1144617 RepID=UPI0039C1A3EC